MAFPVNIFQLSVKYRRIVLVYRDVGDYEISSKYFSTLSEMPMDAVSVDRDVGDRGICSKYFATLGKIPTDSFRL
jgi:hypothetical protein